LVGRATPFTRQTWFLPYWADMGRGLTLQAEYSGRERSSRRAGSITHARGQREGEHTGEQKRSLRSRANGMRGGRAGAPEGRAQRDLQAEDGPGLSKGFCFRNQENPQATDHFLAV
jgi:hypothetical protein